MSNELMALPYGYTVMHEPSIGYTYYDEKGDVALQHPSDNEAARRLVWHTYNIRDAKGLTRDKRRSSTPQD